jgi:ornithine carbamoyltransferase
MHNLSKKALEHLIHTALGHEDIVSAMPTDRLQPTKLVGSLLQGVSSIESKVLQLASARLGYHQIPLGWDGARVKSDEDLISEFSMFSHTVDFLATGFIDRETLGAGRAITEEFARISEVPVVSLADEVFAPQSALGVAAAFWEHLGGLRGKKIAICWGFGSEFVLPNTAHSLLLICTSLGADVVLTTPPDFPLLRRVTRDARERATHSK